MLYDVKDCYRTEQRPRLYSQKTDVVLVPKVFRIGWFFCTKYSPQMQYIRANLDPTPQVWVGLCGDSSPNKRLR